MKLYECTQSNYDGVFIREEDFRNLVLNPSKNHVTLKLLEKGEKIRFVTPKSETLQGSNQKLILNTFGNQQARIILDFAGGLSGALDLFNDIIFGEENEKSLKFFLIFARAHYAPVFSPGF